MPNNRTKGILFILSASFFFGTMNALIRLAGDVPTAEKSFFRNAVAALIAFVLVVRNRKEITVEKHDTPVLLIRAALGTVGILGNFYAIDHMDLADATMLGKLSPFFTILFSAIFIGERIDLKKALLVAGAFVGSLFIIKPSFGSSSLIPGVIGFIGGMGAGAAYTAVRELGRRGVTGSLTVLVFSVFSCFVAIPLSALSFVPPSPTQLLILLLAGLAAAGGQFSITAAYSYAPASEISIYDYTQVILTAIYGYFLFSQIPDTLSFVGYALIILMAVLMFLRNRKTA